MLEFSGNLQFSGGNKQVLDFLEVEKQRGITVKAQTASMFFQHQTSAERYLLNLIDTPGHVDFSYEVSRSLAACQGVLLLVDATQGVQAQTLANFYLALVRRESGAIHQLSCNYRDFFASAMSLNTLSPPPRIHTRVALILGRKPSSTLCP